MLEITQAAVALELSVLSVMAVILGGLVYVVTDINRRLGTDLGPLIPNDGLADGTVAPHIAATDKRTGQAVGFDQFEGQNMLVVFLAPGCGPCVSLVPHLNRLANAYRDVPMFVVLSPGKGADISHDLDERIHVIDDSAQSIGQAYQAQRTPLIYLVSAERKVAHRTISNDFVDLEDTLNKLGRLQGSSRWVVQDEPMVPDESEEPVGSSDISKPSK